MFTKIMRTVTKLSNSLLSLALSRKCLFVASVNKLSSSNKPRIVGLVSSSWFCAGVVVGTSTLNTGLEINRRIVFVIRLLGIGLQGINVFADLMDLGSGLSQSTYDDSMKHIYTSAKIMFNVFSKKAVEEEKKENENRERPPKKYSIFFWSYISLYGVTTLIGYYSCKVMDLVVKRSYCKGCQQWENKKGTQEYLDRYEEHDNTCTANPAGSAGKMEVPAILEMFAASEEKFGVKYGNYIGDGDSKTYKAILDESPYGDDLQVVKSECVGHVQKNSHTQNANESFNATVWRLAPKHLHCGLQIIEIAAYLAGSVFNEGYSAVLLIMQNLEITIGNSCANFAEQYDRNRLQRQNRRSLESTKEARQARRQKTLEEDQLFAYEEGLLCGPGIAE